MEDYTIYQSKLVIYKNIFLKIFFTLLVLLLPIITLVIIVILIYSEGFSLMYLIPSSLVMILACLCELLIIKEVVTTNKVIKLTTKGFYSYLDTEDQLISWNNVKEIQEVNIGGQKMISIWLNEPDLILKKLFVVRRRMIKKKVDLGYGEINITVENIKGINNRELIENMLLFVKYDR